MDLRNLPELLKDRRILTYIFGAGVTIGVIIALCVLLSGGNKEGKTPGDTVAGFYEAINVCDFDTAAGFCDSLSMTEHLEAWAEEWKRLEKEDSSTFAIALSLLEDMKTVVIDSRKEGADRRVLDFNLENGDNVKEKTAVLKKEEGEWKIEQLTDRQ